MGFMPRFEAFREVSKLPHHDKQVPGRKSIRDTVEAVHNYNRN